MFEKKNIILERLNNIKNPIILEFGVNRGGSTNFFFDHINNKGGKLFSIDIRDCSNAINSKEWNFFQCNDLNKDKILKKFSDEPKLLVVLCHVKSDFTKNSISCEFICSK